VPDYDLHTVETPSAYYVLNIVANCKKMVHRQEILIS